MSSAWPRGQGGGIDVVKRVDHDIGAAAASRGPSPAADPDCGHAVGLGDLPAGRDVLAHHNMAGFDAKLLPSDQDFGVRLAVGEIAAPETSALK